jgi:biotin carboxyl carrier protein
LKRFKIHINGQEYVVEIDDPDASPVVVTVNGHPFQVTVSQPGTKAGAQAGEGDEQAARDEGLMLDTYVPAVASTYIEVGPEPESADIRQPPAQTAHSGTETVTAPMPGTVLDIIVQVGDVVQQGDTLCNLEAMKMKSPIRSPSQGTVAQVLISEGQNVAFGDVLFTLGQARPPD